MRVSMLVSVALNLFLLATIVAARVDQSLPADVRPSESTPFTRTARSPHSSSSLEALHDFLREAGIDPADSKSMLLGWLIAANYSNEEEGAIVEYWQPGFMPAESAARNKFLRGQAIRDGLIELFGPAAANDRAFAAVFRPLDPVLSFLSSQQQLVLEKYQVERLRSEYAQNSEISSPSNACFRVSPAATLSVPQDTSAALANLLGESAYEEYLLRFSPLAERLRAADVAEDEAAFRRIYRLLRELQEQSSPSSQVAIRARLRREMGELPFDRFWSSQDPVYAPLAHYLAQQKFSDGQVLAAYSIVNRTQELLLDLMGRQPTQEAMLSAVNRLKQEESLQLVRLLGEQAAAGVAAATTRSAMRLAAASADPC